jgi:H+-transporting ATPase
MTVDPNEKHQETIKRLQSQESGLSNDEAIKRREKYGTNSIEETKTPAIIKFLKKLSGPVPWMLEITAVITYFLGKYIDTYIILALLVFNSIISFLQESRATDAVELLRKKINFNARVLRTGIWKQVPASELVPGDIIHVRKGDIVPADVKIISGVVDSDQSALTGE